LLLRVWLAPIRLILLCEWLLVLFLGRTLLIICFLIARVSWLILSCSIGVLHVRVLLPVVLSLLAIWEYFVSFADFFELLLFSFIHIRMVLLRQLVVSFFDFRFSRNLRNSESLVVVLGYVKSRHRSKKVAWITWKCFKSVSSKIVLKISKHLKIHSITKTLADKWLNAPIIRIF